MKIITFGEIMLRLATPEHLRFGQATSFEASYSGGEANVAVSLAGFGLQVCFVTRLPHHDIGDSALATLLRYHVDTSFIYRGGERLGVYFLETGASHRGSKVVYDRAHSAIADIQTGMIDWENVFAGATWFHWTGITPAISKGAALVCKEACECAARLGITISVDLNYRQNLWKWGRTAGQVMSEIVPYCDLIIANEEDAQKVFGINAQSGDISKGEVTASFYSTVAQDLIRLFPKTSRVAFTLRGSINATHNTWSGALWNGLELLEAPIYDITHIVDRVGAGDSFCAGLIYGLLHFGDDEQKSLNFATAASCLKHTIKGDYNLVTVEEVMKLMQGDVSGRVRR